MPCGRVVKYFRPPARAVSDRRSEFAALAEVVWSPNWRPGAGRRCTRRRTSVCTWCYRGCLAWASGAARIPVAGRILLSGDEKELRLPALSRARARLPHEVHGRP